MKNNITLDLENFYNDSYYEKKNFIILFYILIKIYIIKNLKLIFFQNLNVFL